MMSEASLHAEITLHSSAARIQAFNWSSVLYPSLRQICKRGKPSMWWDSDWGRQRRLNQSRYPSSLNNSSNCGGIGPLSICENKEPMVHWPRRTLLLESRNAPGHSNIRSRWATSTGIGARPGCVCIYADQAIQVLCPFSVRRTRPRTPI